MTFVEQLDGGDRTARIRRDWEHITAHGGSMLLTALAGIAPDVPVLLALLQANMVSASSLTLEQDRAYREALAEVYSVPDPARILFDDVANRLRPTLACAVAHRREREQPTLADYAAADLQLLISEQWAHGMQRHAFRRSSADAIREIAADWSGDGPSVPWWLDAGDHLRDVRERSTEYWRRRWQQIKQRQRNGERPFLEAQRQVEVSSPDTDAPRTAQEPPQNAHEYGYRTSPAITSGAAIMSGSAMLMADEDTIHKVVFGLNMKRARRLAGHMSQEELADKLGVIQPIVSRWETGHREPRPATRKRIADILGQSLDFFYDESVLEEQPE